METIFDEANDKRIGAKLTNEEAALLVRLTQKIPVGQYLEIGFTPQERSIMLEWSNDYTR